MALRADDDRKEEVRDRASIVEIVSRYVALRPSGRNHVGLCPFHAEKTPSFNVNAERAFFHCFGCGESGDVFTFLMKIENLTFPEVLERLAREVGVELPERPAETRRRGERERLAEVNRQAARYFWGALWGEKGSEAARSYLEEREIREETARAFGVGYAPAEGLAAALDSAGISPEDARTLGLVGRAASGRRYDRFRNRIMFPIIDLGKTVTGFGGRLLGEGGENEPKYLNSAESALFHKRRLLFGLARARDAIRETGQVLVVEGYMDVLALAQAGIGNVVAPLGTALTADQVRLLRRFTDRIVVLFDGDEAGLRAASRSFPVFAEVGIFADASFLPAGEDPDTFVRRNGADALRALVGKSSPLVDHYLSSLAGPAAGLPERKRAADVVAELVGEVSDPIFAGLLARRAAEHLRMPEEPILSRARRRSARGDAAIASPEGLRLPDGEALLLEILLVEPSLRENIGDWMKGLLGSEEARELLERIDGLGDAPPPAELLGLLPPPARHRAARALFDDADRREIYGEAERMLRDCLEKLSRARREERLRVLQHEIRSAEHRGDQETVRALQREKMELLSGT